MLVSALSGLLAIHPFPLPKNTCQAFLSVVPACARHANPNGRDIGLIVGPPAPTLPLAHLVYSRGRELLLDVPPE